MQVDSERRAQPRTGLQGSVVLFAGEQRVQCHAVDISASGVAVLSPVVCARGQFVRVNFCLRIRGLPRWYDADGVITRAVRGTEGCLVCVAFSVLEDRAAGDIHAYVHQGAPVAQASRQPASQVVAGMIGTDSAINDRARQQEAAIEFGSGGGQRRPTAVYGALSDLDLEALRRPRKP